MKNSFFANKGKRATYRCTPSLPFQGLFLSIIEIIKRINNGENKTYIDLFGGSFYLSYMIHMIYQSAKVICNDYNNYMKRLQNIQSTQELIN